MVEENTFLNADNLYEDVEGESGKTLSLEEDQQKNLTEFTGLIKILIGHIILQKEILKK